MRTLLLLLTLSIANEAIAWENQWEDMSRQEEERRYLIEQERRDRYERFEHQHPARTVCNFDVLDRLVCETQ